MALTKNVDRDPPSRPGFEKATGSDLQKKLTKNISKKPTQKVKKHKLKKATLALVEAGKTARKNPHMLFSVHSLSKDVRHLCRKIVGDESGKEFRWEGAAFQAIAEGTQEFLLDMFHDLAASATCAKRKTILEADMILVKQISHNLHPLKVGNAVSEDPYLKLPTEKNRNQEP